MSATKRLFDIFFSALLLIALSPALLIIAGLVWSDLGLPILFRQLRAGKDGKPFVIFKFRTMKDNSHGEPISDLTRISPIGRFLRGWSLDELPELLNILIGDMSFVGPRPLLLEYLPLYSTEQARRHKVVPGITGWAQIRGRNTISWEDRFALDVWYVDHQGLLLDFKIILLTIIKALKREGINQDSNTTMERFQGNKA